MIQATSPTSRWLRIWLPSSAFISVGAIPGGNHIRRRRSEDDGPSSRIDRIVEVGVVKFFASLP